MKKLSPWNIKKIKEKTSRMSLTLSLSIFVFVILIAAIGLAALGLWLLTLAGIMVDVNGEIKLGPVILFMSVISLILGGVAVFFSSRLPLKPVNEIINKMNRLASGDFETRLTFGSTMSAHPAVKELTTSFNKMAEELENTELLRNDFINNFSHEFKTPIVSITGLACLLEVGNLTEEQRVQYARAIREESMRLSSMASNILNLTKVENQTILTDVSHFNLSEQVRSAVLLLRRRPQ
jgi:signal transduction histidine kinase